MSRWKKWVGGGVAGGGYSAGVGAVFSTLAADAIVVLLCAIGGTMAGGIAVIAGGAVVVTSAGFVVGNYFDK